MHKDHHRHKGKKLPVPTYRAMKEYMKAEVKLDVFRTALQYDVSHLRGHSYTAAMLCDFPWICKTHLSESKTN
jgi:hypothetical protein